jgi:hypothetical protein
MSPVWAWFGRKNRQMINEVSALESLVKAAEEHLKIAKENLAQLRRLLAQFRQKEASKDGK